MTITEQEIIASCAKSDVKLTLATSDKAFNRLGMPHHELSGKFVRQCDKETALELAKSILLTEIATFVFGRAPDRKAELCFRVWPEAQFGGVNDIYVRWYVRLSIYAVDAQPAVPA